MFFMFFCIYEWIGPFLMTFPLGTPLTPWYNREKARSEYPVLLLLFKYTITTLRLVDGCNDKTKKRYTFRFEVTTS